MFFKAQDFGWLVRGRDSSCGNWECPVATETSWRYGEPAFLGGNYAN